ncbi:hypothetical protein BDF19DRAFT_414576 [Syncephalis fuscata]|nr:hypothetical protein BDF19DRAFT_414576 [Syncephalis fuscata]
MKLAISIIAGLAALQCVDAFDVVKMLCLVNKQRQQNNRLPLGLNQLLVNAANQHSNAQAQANSMSHQLSGEGTPGDRVTQAGYQWTNEETCVQQWMNSPGHRANILGDYTQFGAGVAYSSSNVPYYTQDFGANGEGNNYPECPSDVYGGNSSYTPAPATTTAYEPAPAPAPTATDTYEPAPAPAPTATDTYEPAPAPAPVTTVNGDANTQK